MATMSRHDDHELVEDDVPEDLISAAEAGKLLARSAATVNRLARDGAFDRFVHPDFTGYFYSEADIHAHRAKFRRVRRVGGD